MKSSYSNFSTYTDIDASIIGIVSGIAKYCVQPVFFFTVKKARKPETFVFFVCVFFKHLTLFAISLPNISSSAIEVQVSRISDGFSVEHSFLKLLKAREGYKKVYINFVKCVYNSELILTN